MRLQNTIRPLACALVCLPALALAATPTISNVSGSVQNGQTLTITGSSMVQEDRSNWDPYFNSKPTASGFEGAGFTNDWDGGEAFTYVTDVKLMGSKSALSRHQGATNTNHTNISYGMQLSQRGDMYFRAYLRFKVANNLWANNYHKIFAFYGNNPAWFDWMGNSSNSAYSRVAIITNQNYYGNIPGGPLKQDRWYLVESKFPSGSPHNYKVWIDNQLVIDVNGNTSPQGSAWDAQWDINHCCTPSGYDKRNWWDGFAISSTRVGPASLIEIGNSPNYATATKVYQAPEYLSDSSSQIKVDLSGLGSGPYYLWVTNNRGERSQAYSLSGAQASIPAPNNLRVQ